MRKIAPTFVLRTLVLHFAGTMEWARSSSRLYSLPEGSFMETLTYTHSNSNGIYHFRHGEKEMLERDSGSMQLGFQTHDLEHTNYWSSGCCT